MYAVIFTSGSFLIIDDNIFIGLVSLNLSIQSPLDGYWVHLCIRFLSFLFLVFANQGPAGSVSVKRTLPDLQIVAFSVCPQMAFLPWM